MDMRAKRLLAWARNTFGDVAMDREERLCRFIEEAIEIAHAEGMRTEVLARIMARAYTRSAGAIAQEIGQAQLTLEAFAESIGISADIEAGREFLRIQALPKEHWTARQASKVAIGVAK